MTIILDNGSKFQITNIQYCRAGEYAEDGWPDEHIRVYFFPCSPSTVYDRGWWFVRPDEQLGIFLMDDKVSMRQKESIFVDVVSGRGPEHTGFYRCFEYRARPNAELARDIVKETQNG